MTRWGKPIKNTRRRNAKYRLDENLPLETLFSPGNAKEMDFGTMMTMPELKGLAQGEDMRYHTIEKSSGGERVASVYAKYEGKVYELASSQPLEQTKLIEDDLIANGFSGGANPVTSRSSGAFYGEPSDKVKFPYSHSMNESKQPTTKTLMEGFKRFLNEEQPPPLEGEGEVNKELQMMAQAAAEFLKSVGALFQHMLDRGREVGANYSQVKTNLEKYFAAMEAGGISPEGYRKGYVEQEFNRGSAEELAGRVLWKQEDAMKGIWSAAGAVKDTFVKVRDDPAVKPMSHAYYGAEKIQGELEASIGKKVSKTPTR